MFLLATIDPITQILAVLFGLFFMAGSAFYWHKNKQYSSDEAGLGCFLVLLAGILIIFYGLGAIDILMKLAGK